MKQSKVVAIQRDSSQEHLETPTVHKVFDRLAYCKPQGPRTGVNAIMGRWPGTESEAEILAVLEEIS